jgi:amino-acid N-acetyltransferase
MDETTTSKYASWFRDSTPYISAHRGRTFVVLVGGDALAHDNLDHIVHDLALLHVLGVRVVLVHGARPQIDAALPNSTFHGPRRVTDPADMEQILGIFGQLRSRLEALFSTGLPTSPLHKADIAIVSGNFIVARPIGVVTGVDHLLTGKTRRVHAPRINAALDAGGLVMLSPLGYSPSGQAFNLAADELAADVAIALAADKLIAFDSDGYARDPDGAPITELSPTAAASILDGTQYSPATRGHLQAMVRATRGGVPRSHLVSFVQDGALLGELFTARGQGTQVSEKSSDLIRPANADDLAGIVALIRPLEEAGVLLRRSRDRLEQEIEQFLVAEIDGIVVGCCAVYPFDSSAELACVAVHASYRNGDNPGLGTLLVEAAERAAAAAGFAQLFVLTTQTRDWFVEKGFQEADPESLPGPKQALYNYQRNSKVLVKHLA